MINYIKDSKRKNLCFGCGACQNICPIGSIIMVQDNEGFLYPYINKETCISCGKCEELCPRLPNSKYERRLKKPLIYAAFCKDEDIREKSSSGGIFTLLAINVINDNGVVFGVSFDKDLNVVHKYVEDVNELEEFMGSKYVQSYVGKTYKQAEDFLKQGRQVLFSGTPCQIAGLGKYLNKEYSNLLTCDIVCHGTPSPKVYKKYISYLSDKYNSKVEKIFFRNKEKGWRKFSFKINFKNIKFYRSDLTVDPFLNGFLKNLYLRPSCHVCSFSNINRVADITLGDYWGVAKYHPEMDDDRGTSLVLVNTEKGKEIFEKCKSSLEYIESTIEKAVSGNACLERPCIPHKDRENFFKALNSQPFKKVLNKYMLPPPLIFRTIKRIILFGKHAIKYILKRFGLLSKK